MEENLKMFRHEQILKKLLVLLPSTYLIGLAVYLFIYFQTFTLSAILLVLFTPIVIRNMLHVLFSILRIQDILNYFLFGFSLFLIGFLLFLGYFTLNILTLFTPSIILIVVGICLF